MLKKSSGGGFGKDPEDESKTVRTPSAFGIGTTITDEKGAPPENYMIQHINPHQPMPFPLRHRG